MIARVDLGDPKVQQAVTHYLNACFVALVTLQPNCRATCLPSCFNANVNYETWHERHQEDLPRITFCGKVATLQDDLRRLFVREQPVGTWVHEMPP